MKKSKKAPPPSKALTIENLRAGVKKLSRRIEELRSFDVGTITERFDPKAQALTDKINSTIADIFGRDTPEYHDYSIWSLDTLPLIVGGPEYPLPEVQEAYQKGINDAVTKLTSLRETLEEKIIDLEPQEAFHGEPDAQKVLPGNRQIFIVHGHDELAKQTVARFITKLELEPIILHEQPSGGRTIVEKLEAHTVVDFAVVLLTPDDVGHPADSPDVAKPRARQNVILELGLFLGTLGRARVCALYKGEVEIPSDYHGVLYIEMDDAGAWKLPLAREIKQAGIEIDMNKAL